MRGDLREDGEDPFADLGNAGDDLRAATVIDLGPGGGAVHGRGTCDTVPAGRHAASAFPGHYSAASCFSSAAKRAPSETGGRIPGPPRSPRVSPREHGTPASQADPFSSALSARVRLTVPSFCFVCVMAPSRMALMRRISNGSRPSFSAQMSRWDSVANAVCNAPNDRKAPDGVL